jgi:hypothetical protein
LASSRLICSGQVSGPPDLYVRIGQVGVLFHVHDVGQRHQAAPQPDSGAIYGSHQRNSAARHTQDDLATMEDGLGTQIFVLPQLLEIPEVAAGGERPTGAGDYRRASLAILAEVCPYVRQPDVQRVVYRIQRIGPVQRDDAQRPVGLDIDFRWQVVHFRLLIRGCARR